MTKEWEKMVTIMVENKVEVYGFAETNFNWNQVTTRMCVNGAMGAVRRETGKKTSTSLQTSACMG